MNTLSNFQSLSQNAQNSVLFKSATYFLLPAILVTLFISIDFTKEIPIKKYEPGMIVYADRNYSDNKKIFSGDNLFLAVGPRHLYTRVYVESDKPIRLVTAMDSNFPTEDLSDWVKLKTPFFIPAKGLKMDTLLAKNLPAGTHPVPLGHELANPPIFIETAKKKTKLKAWKILEFNKPHIIGSIWKYKRRMAMLLLAWLLWGALCFIKLTKEESRKTTFLKETST